MDSLQSSPMDEAENQISPSAMELRHRLDLLLDQLSPERLQMLSDFAAYLANIESDAATQELWEIPRLLKRVKALTGYESVKIRTEICTDKITEYLWKDVLVVDTPKIHAGKIDHHQMILEKLSTSDLLVFVILNELFNPQGGNFFSKGRGLNPNF